MNNLLTLPSHVTQSRGLTLILTANQERQAITGLIANLILQGPLFIISANEWLPAYALTRIIRRKTLKLKQTLNGLHTVRTSTCYRLLDALANIPPSGEPLLILDFLHTFYDEDVPLPVRFYRLRQCCRHLERLALGRAVIVLTQEMPHEDYNKFCPILRSITDETLYVEPILEPISQPTLF